MSDLVTIGAPARTVKELVVISGKGGTGKTSLVASFAALARGAVLADCDVDAADLHLVLTPAPVTKNEFVGGKVARIDPGGCMACGTCFDFCRFDAIACDGAEYVVNEVACEGCGVCAWLCPEKTIGMMPRVSGHWFVSNTRHGPMVHARLGVAQENSGKLVTTVRAEARRVAEEQGIALVIIDGSPGIGCPVIASVSASDLVLVVTEPTLSGMHDLERVADLTRRFGIETLVCINKWDINPEVAARIEAMARERGLGFAGRIRFDRSVTEAQIRAQAVVEYQAGGCAEDIRAVWDAVLAQLGGADAG